MDAKAKRAMIRQGAELAVSRLSEPEVQFWIAFRSTFGYGCSLSMDGGKPYRIRDSDGNETRRFDSVDELADYLDLTGVA